MMISKRFVQWTVQDQELMDAVADEMIQRKADEMILADIPE